MGGQVFVCEDCEEPRYSYHSCQNRHCPKCMNDRTEKWLEKQTDLLLPTHYFLVTFTLPQELRPVARSNQKTVYDILFRTSAAALKELAADPRFVGGLVGMSAYLHTWSRDVNYHPHIHCLVPGGGFCPDTGKWLPAGEKFLVPVKALSVIFRAKFRDELKKTDLFGSVGSGVWKKAWVVHSKPAGSGEQVLKYFAPYVFRVALSNNRIISIDDGMITFRYQDSDTGQWRQMTLPATEFIRRFLQHVLPKGFMKIRYYGFLSSSCRETLSKIRYFLSAVITLLLNPFLKLTEKAAGREKSEKPDEMRCPHCGGKLILQKIIAPHRRGPP